MHFQSCRNKSYVHDRQKQNVPLKYMFIGAAYYSFVYYTKQSGLDLIDIAITVIRMYTKKRKKLVIFLLSSYANHEQRIVLKCRFIFCLTKLSTRNIVICI